MKPLACILVAAVMVLCNACDDDAETKTLSPDAGVDAPVIMNDAQLLTDVTATPIDADLMRIQVGCLEQPDRLPLPPAGSLPCDLRPPQAR